MELDTDKQAVKIFKALGDETRYRIVKLLLERGELSCGDFDNEFHLSKPAMSHHYRVLENAGLITTRKEGAHIYISLNKTVLEQLLSGFISIQNMPEDLRNEERR